jgi:hypothetical protein
MADRTLRRLFASFALLTLAATVLALFPARPTAAQETEIQTLDNTQLDFAEGLLQRTSITADPATFSLPPGSRGADLKGAVLLSPLGVLKPWSTGVTLPDAGAIDKSLTGDNGTRTDAGVVTVGNRLFVVTGTTERQDGLSTSTDTILWANVEQKQGVLSTHGVANTDPRYVDAVWLQARLPAVRVLDIAQCPNNAAFLRSKRTRAAVTSITTGATTGYIFVIGGLFENGTCTPLEDIEFTSSAIQVIPVTASGPNMAGIQTFRLPSAVLGGFAPAQRGVQMAGAVAIRTSPTKAFLYVSGGLSTYPTTADEPADNLERTVYRAEINLATGALGAFSADLNLDGTVNASDYIPTEGGTGLFDHAMVPINFTDFGLSRDGFVVAGGYTQDRPTRVLNQRVFRARISDANTGAAIWDATPSSSGDNIVTLDQSSLGGLTGVAFNQKLYMVGGFQPGAAPPQVSSVQTTTFDENLLLRNVPGSQQFFVGGGAQVLPLPRANAGAALMDRDTTGASNDENLGTTWVFVAGGEGSDGRPTRTIFRGLIGGDEAETNFRASEGWFYSQVFDVAFQRPGETRKDARLLAIRWSADINRTQNTGADLQVQFRKANLANCAQNFETLAEEWVTLDGDPSPNYFSRTATALDPFNSVSLGNNQFIATCFQYRARFIQHSVDGVPTVGPNPGASPRLFNVSVEKIVVGNVDLRVKEFSTTVNDGRMSAFITGIQNLSLDGIQNTQDAGLVNDGSFFVHLCVAYSPPGQPAPTLTLPTLPTQSGAKLPCMQAYYEVYKWQMRAGNFLNLTNQGDQRWRRVSDNSDITDIRTLFSEPGTYRVAMLIDAWNFVDEGLNGKGNNRGEEAVSDNQPQVLTFTITGNPINELYLPLVAR